MKVWKQLWSADSICKNSDWALNNARPRTPSNTALIASSISSPPIYFWFSCEWVCRKTASFLISNDWRAKSIAVHSHRGGTLGFLWSSWLVWVHESVKCTSKNVIEFVSNYVCYLYLGIDFSFFLSSVLLLFIYLFIYYK